MRTRRSKLDDDAEPEETTESKENEGKTTSVDVVLEESPETDVASAVSTKQDESDADQMTEGVLSSDKVEERILDSVNVKESVLNSDRVEGDVDLDKMIVDISDCDKMEEGVLNSDRVKGDVPNVDKMVEDALDSDKTDEGVLNADSVQGGVSDSDRVEENVSNSDRVEGDVDLDKMIVDISDSEKTDEGVLNSDSVEGDVSESGILEESVLNSDRVEGGVSNVDRMVEDVLDSEKTGDRVLNSDRVEGGVSESDRVEENVLDSDKTNEGVLNSDKMEQVAPSQTVKSASDEEMALMDYALTLETASTTAVGGVKESVNSSNQNGGSSSSVTAQTESKISNTVKTPDEPVGGDGHSKITTVDEPFSWKIEKDIIEIIHKSDSDRTPKEKSALRNDLYAKNKQAKIFGNKICEKRNVTFPNRTVFHGIVYRLYMDEKLDEKNLEKILESAAQDKQQPLSDGVVLDSKEEGVLSTLLTSDSPTVTPDQMKQPGSSNLIHEKYREYAKKYCESKDIPVPGRKRFSRMMQALPEKQEFNEEKFKILLDQHGKNMETQMGAAYRNSQRSQELFKLKPDNEEHKLLPSVVKPMDEMSEDERARQFSTLRTELKNIENTSATSSGVPAKLKSNQTSLSKPQTVEEPKIPRKRLRRRNRKRESATWSEKRIKELHDMGLPWSDYISQLKGNTPDMLALKFSQSSSRGSTQSKLPVDSRSIFAEKPSQSSSCTATSIINSRKLPALMDQKLPKLPTLMEQRSGATGSANAGNRFAEKTSDARNGRATGSDKTQSRSTVPSQLIPEYNYPAQNILIANFTSRTNYGEHGSHLERGGRNRAETSRNYYSRSSGRLSQGYDYDDDPMEGSSGQRWSERGRFSPHRKNDERYDKKLDAPVPPPPPVISTIPAVSTSRNHYEQLARKKDKDGDWKTARREVPQKNSLYDHSDWSWRLPRIDVRRENSQYDEDKLARHEPPQKKSRSDEERGLQPVQSVNLQNEMNVFNSWMSGNTRTAAEPLNQETSSRRSLGRASPPEDLPKTSQVKEVPPIYRRGNVRKVGIVHEDYPGRELTSEEGDLIRAALFERIGLQSGVGPRFIDTYDEQGAVVFECEDLLTVSWVWLNASTIVPWKSARLKPTSLEKPPKEIAIQVPKMLQSLTPRAFCDRLMNQNPGLTTKDWDLKSSDITSGRDVELCFCIDDGSLDALKSLDLKPYLGFSRVNVRIIRE